MLRCAAPPAQPAATLQELANNVRIARTAYLHRHGVPISEEFAHFADVLGDLLERISPVAASEERTPVEAPPDYKALCGELLAALVAVLKLMDDGILVRDIRNDADPAWAIKQIPLVLALKKAQEAIKAAKEAGIS